MPLTGSERAAAAIFVARCGFPSNKGQPFESGRTDLGPLSRISGGLLPDAVYRALSRMAAVPGCKCDELVRAVLLHDHIARGAVAYYCKMVSAATRLEQGRGWTRTPDAVQLSVLVADSLRRGLRHLDGDVPEPLGVNIRVDVGFDDWNPGEFKERLAPIPDFAALTGDSAGVLMGLEHQEPWSMGKDKEALGNLYASRGLDRLAWALQPDVLCVLSNAASYGLAESAMVALVAWAPPRGSKLAGPWSRAKQALAGFVALELTSLQALDGRKWLKAGLQRANMDTATRDLTRCADAIREVLPLWVTPIKPEAVPRGRPPASMPSLSAGTPSAPASEYGGAERETGGGPNAFDW